MNQLAPRLRPLHLEESDHRRVEVHRLGHVGEDGEYPLYCVLHEARGQQVEETMDALSEGPESF